MLSSNQSQGSSFTVSEYHSNMPSEFFPILPSIGQSILPLAMPTTSNSYKPSGVNFLQPRCSSVTS